MKLAKQRAAGAPTPKEIQTMADFCAANPNSIQAFFFNETARLQAQWKANKRKNK